MYNDIQYLAELGIAFRKMISLTKCQRAQIGFGAATSPLPSPTTINTTYRLRFTPLCSSVGVCLCSCLYLYPLSSSSVSMW